MSRIWWLAIVLFPGKLFSQKDSSQKVVGINIHYGQIYVHSVAVRNVKGARPFGAEIEFSRQRMSQQAFENCNCYPKTGFQLSAMGFGRKVLGEGIAVSHFLEPQYKVSKNLSFRLKGSIGLIYLTNPYRPVKNPENNSYSTHINPYFNLGWGFGYNLDKHWSLALMGFFHHTSNSGFKQPNRGINWVTSAVSLQYQSQTTRLPSFKRNYNRYWKGKPIKFEAGMFFMPHQQYNSRLGIERSYITGVFVQGIKQVGRISGIVGGTEMYYTKFRQALEPVKNKTIIGLQAGHVFLLNRTAITQQIGIDVVNKTVTKTDFYTRWSFTYRFGDHIKLGASLKAQADYADFADFRLSYLF